MIASGPAANARAMLASPSQDSASMKREATWAVTRKSRWQARP